MSIYKRLNSKRGFTLVELMIVVSIIAVLLTIALPTYATMRKNAKAKICSANLRQIYTAIQTWSFENDIPDGVALTPYAGEIYSYIRNGEPKCPSGGAYVLGNLGYDDEVVCSSGLEGHTYK